MKIFKLCIFDRTFSLESQVTLCASGTHTKLSTKHWSNMSCFFIPSLHNLMVVDPSLLKSSENIGRDGQNQLFQNSWNLPKASNNLRSIYLRKTAESHWAGFVALQLELLPSLFAQVCSNLENQQACSHWMGRACWGASKKKKKGHSESIVPIWPVVQLPGKALFHCCHLTWLELRTWSAGKPCPQGLCQKQSVATDTQLLRGQ